MTHVVTEGKHAWPGADITPQEIAGSEFPDGHIRTLRVCRICGASKVTVHGDGWARREWRTKDGHVWQGAGEPPCLGEATS